MIQFLALFLVCTWIPFCYILTWLREKDNLSCISSYKGTHHEGLHPHDLNHLPQAPPPNIIAWTIRASTRAFYKDMNIQSLATEYIYQEGGNLTSHLRILPTTEENRVT